MAAWVQDLRGVMMLVCLAIFVVVFAVMLVSAWRNHRLGEPAKQNFHSSMAVEVCWAVAPFVIVVMLVWPTVRTVLNS
jgi:heme/copper-type cytochrome/quinol oxidase subunit 2